MLRSRILHLNMCRQLFLLMFVFMFVHVYIFTYGTFDIYVYDMNIKTCGDSVLKGTFTLRPSILLRPRLGCSNEVLRAHELAQGEADRQRFGRGMSGKGSLHLRDNGRLKQVETWM